MAAQKIPGTVKTSLVNIMMSIEELNKKEGEKPYIMVVDQRGDMIIMGCSCLADVIFYSDYFHKFEESIDLEDITVMRALITDPADLPFRMPSAASAFVLNEEIGINKFDFMCEATEHIETIVDVFKDMEIEDFAVLIGIEFSETIRSRVINKIEEKRLERIKGRSTAGGQWWQV